MHNARISGGDHGNENSNSNSTDARDPDVTPDAIVADAPAAAAKLDEQAAASPSPPPPPPSAQDVGKVEKRGGGGEGGGGGANPFPIVLYGNGSDLDEVSRLLYFIVVCADPARFSPQCCSLSPPSVEMFLRFFLVSFLLFLVFSSSSLLESEQFSLEMVKSSSADVVHVPKQPRQLAIPVFFGCARARSFAFVDLL